MKEKLFQVGLYVKESQFRQYILKSSLDILRYDMKGRIEGVIRAYDSLDESDASAEVLMDMIERMREDLVVSSMQLEENINSFNLFKENTKDNSDDNSPELLLENETEE